MILTKGPLWELIERKLIVSSYSYLEHSFRFIELRELRSDVISWL